MFQTITIMQIFKEWLQEQKIFSLTQTKKKEKHNCDLDTNRRLESLIWPLIALAVKVGALGLNIMLKMEMAHWSF